MFVHTSIINEIIRLKGFTSYLEIGINDPSKNFDLINCKFRVGVDPAPTAKANFFGTSDEFFDSMNVQKNLVTKCGAISLMGYESLNPVIRYDCILIDGLHHADQVKKDFENSLSCLNEGGIILIHDTNPAEERFTAVPRKERGRWNGDVWKFITELYNYPVEWRTVKEDANGLTVVKIGNGSTPPPEGERDWAYFTQHKEAFLNLCSFEELKQWI